MDAPSAAASMPVTMATCLKIAAPLPVRVGDHGDVHLLRMNAPKMACVHATRVRHHDPNEHGALDDDVEMGS
jgi:hypothetical protein